MFANGPPLFPGLMEVSVWITLSRFSIWVSGRLTLTRSHCDVLSQLTREWIAYCHNLLSVFQLTAITKCCEIEFLAFDIKNRQIIAITYPDDFCRERCVFAFWIDSYLDSILNHMRIGSNMPVLGIDEAAPCRFRFSVFDCTYTVAPRSSR